MENGSVVLRAEQVKKYFPVQGGLGRPKRMVKAVDGVDLEVKKGEIYGLVGETGCGKSTLGRTLIRLTEPTEGKVQILGKEITGLHGHDLRNMRQDVQMVFQDPYTSLDPRQKVGDILMEALEIHGIGSKSQRMDTSRADTGSSQMMIFGFKISARARPILCLCPPESPDASRC